METRMTEDRRKRLIHTLKIALEILVCLVLYIGIYLLTDHGIPCVFRMITGLQCPGCGMTRALGALARGNLAEAVGYNLLSVTLCPLVLGYLILKSVKYIKSGSEEFSAFEILFLVFCFIFCVLYFMFRNNLI